MLRTMLVTALLHWAILVTPGVNVLIVTQMAATGQRRAAMGAACGVTMVAVAWAILAVLGVQALFEAHEALRRVVQGLGGLYLVYVATRLWRSGSGQRQLRPLAVSFFGGLRKGVMTNLMNPKSALFFSSVFAAALPLSPAPGTQTAAVAVVFFNALLWHVALAQAFSLAKVQSWYARYGRWMSRGSGALVGLVGVQMALGSAVTSHVGSQAT